MTTRTLINALCVTATLLPATLATAQPRPVPVPRPAPSPTPQQVETQTPVAEPLTLSEPVVGGLNNRDHTAADGTYVDYYQLELTAGHAYHFSVTGQGFATNVEVLNADGSELVGTKTYTDDNLFILYTAKTAVYTIAVSTENAGDSGRYILHAVEGDERMPPRENQAGDVSIPAGTEPFAGELNDQSETSGQGRFFAYSIVELEAGQTYCLYVQSPDNGVFADIVSIDNNPVEYLAIEQEGAFIRVTPTVSGPHAISTITKRPGNATSYTGYAWAASTGSSTTIVDQLSAESVRLDDGTYFDFHEVELTADTTYVIDVTSEDFDAVAYLFDASNNQLAVNDQAEGTGTNAQITFTPETSGTYFVGVGTPTAGATGGYMARIASGDRIGQDAGISITRGDDVEEEMTGIADSPLVGHWELVSVASNGRTEQVPAGAASYAFDADGNMTSYANGQVSDNSSYTVEGNRFSMTEDDGSVEVSTFQIQGDTMTVTFVEPQTSAGTVLVLKRIEAAPAPGANTNPALHGRWEATIVTANGQDNKIPAGAIVFEFLPNGRVQMSDNGNVSGQGTYTNDGDALLISLDGEDAIEHNTFRVQGDTLTINTIIPPNTPAVIRFKKIEGE